MKKPIFQNALDRVTNFTKELAGVLHIHQQETLPEHVAVTFAMFCFLSGWFMFTDLWLQHTSLNLSLHYNPCCAMSCPFTWQHFLQHIIIIPCEGKKCTLTFDIVDGINISPDSCGSMRSLALSVSTSTSWVADIPWPKSIHHGDKLSASTEVTHCHW